MTKIPDVQSTVRCRPGLPSLPRQAVFKVNTWMSNFSGECREPVEVPSIRTLVSVFPRQCDNEKAIWKTAPPHFQLGRSPGHHAAQVWPCLATMAWQDHSHRLHALASTEVLKTQAFGHDVTVGGILKCGHKCGILLILSLLNFIWIPTLSGPIKLITQQILLISLWGCPMSDRESCFPPNFPRRCSVPVAYLQMCISRNQEQQLRPGPSGRGDGPLFPVMPPPPPYSNLCSFAWRILKDGSSPTFLGEHSLNWWIFDCSPFPEAPHVFFCWSSHTPLSPPKESGSSWGLQGLPT